MTLIELLVGLVTAVIIAGICAKVLQLGIMTYTFSARQNAFLSQVRKAVAGDGAHLGLLWEGRGSTSFSALSAVSMAVVSSDSVNTSFFIANGNLYRTKATDTVIQASGINSLSLNYYNMSAAGVIMTSTAPESATLATALVTMQGNSNTQKTYTLFSGARLRNHP